MRLITGLLKSLSDLRVAEGDPLPPDDRMVIGSALVLEDLYRTRASKLHRFFAQRTERQDAGDLVQESFIRLAEASASKEKVIDHPEAYLNQIATNILRDRAKMALQKSLARQVNVDEVSIPGPDMVAALEARDTLNRLQTALMKLKPRTRDIFLAHRVDGMSYRDIARDQGLSIKGVEWHMHKAITQLDRVLRPR